MMTDSIHQTPEQTVSSDPGDDTARRFRYQWTQAAVICCQLLDGTFDTVEVFCEQHEDVLLKHDTGHFTGIQIKTRDNDQPPWKTRDEAVQKSLVRFSLLEQEFPGCFREFRFLTNHQLFRANNGQDLKYVLGAVKEHQDTRQMPGPVAAVVRRVSRESGCPENIVVSALAKAAADDGLPKLQDNLARLVSTLTQIWPRAEDYSHSVVENAAQRLIEECARASSLAHLETLPAYLPATPRPADAELEARIAHKRFDLARITEVLESGLRATVPLDGDPSELRPPGGGSIPLLRQKLDAGGFSAVSLNSAEDLRNKADYLAFTWLSRLGAEKGLQRYTHIQSLVLRDSANAYEGTKRHGDPFGVRMLEDLRNRLTIRVNRSEATYEASLEHLEGFAYGLTSLCKVTWSIAEPWNVE